MAEHTNRAARCRHGFYETLCPEWACPHYDGGGEEQRKREKQRAFEAEKRRGQPPKRRGRPPKIGAPSPEGNQHV